MANVPDGAVIHCLRKVRTRVGIVHRFLLAQEFRLLAAMLVLAPVPWLEDHALFTDRHVLQEIQSDGGRAAYGRIPEVVKPAMAERGFRVCESREVLEMEGLQATRIGYFVVNRVRQRFPDFDPLLFRCFHTRLGDMVHEDIRRAGRGLHDYDGVLLRFSSSDGSHPVDNGRVYLIAIPWGGSGTVAMACQALIALFAYVLVRKRIWPWIRARYRTDKFLGIVAASVVSTAIVLSVVAILMEAYLRWRIPFTETEWPLRFDPELGFVYQPNARIRWTNHLDFWVEQTSNSLGFPDREPAVPKPDGMFRVLVVGDSYVEALQVGLARKMHVVLESRLRDALGTDKVDTVAFGYSGTGQSNQLSFYDRYGADVDADLVVLLFVYNDFRDNSAALGSIWPGWDPWRPPRLFYEPDEDGVTFTQVGIDADWANHRLVSEESMGRQREVMERHPETRALFGDWLASDAPPDCMFYLDELPPVFKRALASTEHALRLFKERTKNRGEKLLLVITPGVVTDVRHCPDDSRYTFDELNQLKRITGIAARLGVPVLDLHSAFAARGDWRDTEFAHDRHWNALGHRWAAEAIADYLLEHRELLSPTHGERP